MAKARKPKTTRVLVRAEWIEELPTDAVPQPGASLEAGGRELTVWSVGEPRREERPVCDVRVRAAEIGLLAGWQLAAMEAAQRGWAPPAQRNDEAPTEPPASWGVRVRLVAHLREGRLEPVTLDKRELTLDQVLDALVDAAEDAVRRWKGGTFGVTGRVVLTADRREQLHAEIVRTRGGPDDVVGVIDAMEAVADAAERLYSGEEVPTDATADGDELEDPWESIADETPKFRYSVEFEGGVDPLDTDEELQVGQTIEYAGILCVVHSIDPPDAEGIRAITLRRLHPDPTR